MRLVKASLAFAAAMPEATAPACFATRKRGQFAKLHIVGPAEEADASKSPHAPRGCAEASAWATWLMKGNAPASFWIRPQIHQCRGVVQCKNVMEQSMCSLSIVLHIQHDVAVHWGRKKWSKKLMPLFKDSNHPSCPKKEIYYNILKQNRKASSNHFHLSVQAHRNPPWSRPPSLEAPQRCLPGSRSQGSNCMYYVYVSMS